MNYFGKLHNIFTLSSIRVIAKHSSIFFLLFISIFSLFLLGCSSPSVPAPKVVENITNTSGRCIDYCPMINQNNCPNKEMRYHYEGIYPNCICNFECIRTINMTVKKWIYEPDQIILKNGETVHIYLKNIDSIEHGIYIPVYEINQTVGINSTTDFYLSANKGIAQINFSSSFSGSGYGGMGGIIFVEDEKNETKTN